VGLFYNVGPTGGRTSSHTEEVYYSVVVAGKQSNHILEHGHEAVADDTISQLISRHLAMDRLIKQIRHTATSVSVISVHLMTPDQPTSTQTNYPESAE